MTTATLWTPRAADFAQGAHPGGVGVCGDGQDHVVAVEAHTLGYEELVEGDAALGGDDGEGFQHFAHLTLAAIDLQKIALAAVPEEANGAVAQEKVAGDAGGSGDGVLECAGGQLQGIVTSAAAEAEYAGFGGCQPPRKAVGGAAVEIEKDPDIGRRVQLELSGHEAPGAGG